MTARSSPEEYGRGPEIISPGGSSHGRLAAAHMGDIGFHALDSPEPLRADATAHIGWNTHSATPCSAERHVIGVESAAHFILCGGLSTGAAYLVQGHAAGN